MSPGPQCQSRPQHREACVVTKVLCRGTASRTCSYWKSPWRLFSLCECQWCQTLSWFEAPAVVVVSSFVLLLCSSPVQLSFLPAHLVMCCCWIQNRRLGSVTQLQPWLCCPCYITPCGDTRQPKVWLWAPARDCNTLGPITHSTTAMISVLAPAPQDVSPSCEWPTPPLSCLSGSGCRSGVPTMWHCSSQLPPLTALHPSSLCFAHHRLRKGSSEHVGVGKGQGSGEPKSRAKISGIWKCLE